MMRVRERAGGRGEKTPQLEKGVIKADLVSQLQLPKPTEVLHEYESMLETLTVQPKFGVFAATEPETMLSL